MRQSIASVTHVVDPCGRSSGRDPDGRGRCTVHRWHRPGRRSAAQCSRSGVDCTPAVQCFDLEKGSEERAV